MNMKGDQGSGYESASSPLMSGSAYKSFNQAAQGTEKKYSAL